MPTHLSYRQAVGQSGGAGDATEDLVEAIVVAVAEATSRPVSELRTPLLDVVDPDALVQLLTATGKYSVELHRTGVCVEVTDESVSAADELGDEA
ncbi:HalOD1 output domain-containing protein [Halomicroarcula sp. GCM10025324]|jgi:hypothetical protein|uniref:HalOD1 output domain-containing protein n=1 Tax=Haloarcula TaxID=2237 RepID=UPI0023E8677C|nr:HalOD1 output domain-containing protein [Halomicroarcula sp. ZS-22-S1]